MCDALYRYICLEILEDYVVEPRDCRLLHTYWEQLMIVACMVRCCSAEFKGFRGVTQEGPLSPTIFNVVVDTMVLHWVFLVVEVEECP